MLFLRTNKNLIPILLLVLLSIYTILTVLFMPVYQDGKVYQLAFTPEHYGAFAAILLNLLAYFFYRRFFKPLLLLTLVLASFGLLNFLPISIKFGVGFIVFSPIGLSFSPVGLGIVLLYYFLNKPVAHAFINQHILPTPSPEKAKQKRRESIDQFKKTFSRRSDEDLYLMLQEQKVVPNALAAAKELLQERKAIDTTNA